MEISCLLDNLFILPKNDPLNSKERLVLLFTFFPFPVILIGALKLTFNKIYSNEMNKSYWTTYAMIFCGHSILHDHIVSLLFLSLTQSHLPGFLPSARSPTSHRQKASPTGPEDHPGHDDIL